MPGILVAALRVFHVKPCDTPESGAIAARQPPGEGRGSALRYTPATISTERVWRLGRRHASRESQSYRQTR
jgi:hypothetical protein